MWSRDMGRVANLFVICAGRTGVGMKVATLPRRGTDDRFLSSVARPALDPLPRTTDHTRRWSVPLPEGTLGRLSRVRPIVNRPVQASTDRQADWQSGVSGQPG